MLNKRIRPVNIRVTEEEYRDLYDACHKMGTRNVSELAREALRLILDEHVLANLPNAMACLDELAGRLNNLQVEVQRLKSLLSANG